MAGYTPGTAQCSCECCLYLESNRWFTSWKMSFSTDVPCLIRARSKRFLASLVCFIGVFFFPPSC